MQSVDRTSPALAAKVWIALAAGHKTSALLGVAVAHPTVAAAEKVGARVDDHRSGRRSGLATQGLLLQVDRCANAKLGAPVLFAHTFAGALIRRFSR